MGLYNSVPFEPSARNADPPLLRIAPDRHAAGPLNVPPPGRRLAERRDQSHESNPDLIPPRKSISVPLNGFPPRSMDSWSDRPLELAPLVFFDLETTGIRPDRRGHIVEIAVVDTDAVLHAWATDRSRPRDTVIARQCRTLYDLFANRIVVGHNLQFDFGFLAHEADRIGLRGPDLRFVDTLALSRRLVDTDDAQLDTLADRFDLVPESERHTALGDARAARALFWTLADRGDLNTLSEVGVRTLRWSTF